MEHKTQGNTRVLNRGGLSILSIFLILLISPMDLLADKKPGYEAYKDGHEGYVGDGILKEGVDEMEELARAVQNPVADLISLPFQNNTHFNFGPREKTRNVLNIQPVIPFDLNEEWLLITRTILPVVSQPSLIRGQDRENGLGDSLFTAFFSPKDRNRWIGGKILWGAGPALLLPTSTDSRLGPGEWGAGPSAVFLAMPGKWVIGSLLSNVWSFSGDQEVNLFTWQYFVNYNLPKGWYLTSSPVVTANWSTNSGDRWLIPVGGGFGRVFRLGRMPLNASVQAFKNVTRPSNADNWSLRFQLQFLFPR